MNILLVYPQYPDTFWSFRHALKFISRKAAVPPLGLITVSAMLPAHWNKKLVDINIAPLLDKDIIDADYVFISAMYVQKESVKQVIGECQKHGTKIVAGGPLFTQESANYPEVDHFILNEAEITLPPFLKALESGVVPERVYQTGEFADMTRSPVPDYHLLTMKAYASMNIQVTRGCPFACDFCEITSLLGHKVRQKETAQILETLDTLYALHWRGPVAIVDDNFIGNKREMKSDLLPALKKWMQIHRYPFTFTTQTSINLADDEELLTMMTDAGVGSAFIGIETPDETSLHHCNKIQNQQRDMIMSVKKIQLSGMEVSGGFIVGFDSDSPSIFRQQIDFIQKSGIVTAMVGLLNAPKNTKLYRRLESENRLTAEATGSNTDFSMNFTPRMNQDELLAGYQSILKNIYAVKPYYQRVRRFLLDYNRQRSGPKKINYTALKGFIISLVIIGILNKGRREYWSFLLWTLMRRPGYLVEAVTFSVYGYHFRTIFGLRNVTNVQKSLM